MGVRAGMTGLSGPLWNHGLDRGQEVHRRLGSDCQRTIIILQIMHLVAGYPILSGPSMKKRAFMRTQLISCRLPKAERAITVVALSPPVPFRLFFVRWISVGEGVSLPRPRIQVVHGTVPQQCARNPLPARSGFLCRPAIEGLRCHPLPTSSTRAPEVTPN